MVEKKCKIVMTTMFQNESKTIRRMLESCYKYIDFWVIQNNGSTDGTEEIVKEFFTEHKIPGFLYNVEEGWVGFGWNRDHLTQTCQSLDHGCDWILKMDCDEILQVDDDFDWSILDDTSVHSWEIPCVQGTSTYTRCWMWNANMKWRFNHDPCHETVYCADESIGDKFQRVLLPQSFRQTGFNEGQSWGVPTKFMSHALILEEKMMVENSFKTNLYHFWYIGKSYFDAWESNNFPLGESQKKEYGRRCIYYFGEYLNHTHRFNETQSAQYIDEVSYMSMLMIAQIYGYFKDNENQISYLKLANSFAPGRNDHFLALAYKYQELNDWKNMHQYTSIMMQPERTNAYPTYTNFVNSAIYHDGGPLISELHQYASDRLQEENKHNEHPPFYINKSYGKKLFVVDNFYNNPDTVREFALNQVEYKEDLRWYKGLRSVRPYRPKGIKEAFEFIMGEPIVDFQQGYNGVFQICIAQDPQVYHYDMQKWAAMIYMTPDAPLESGTRLHRSKINGARRATDADADRAFSGGFYDSTKFDVADSAGNLYNRLVIMDARCIHSAGPYFGQNKQDGRLTHLFFFD